MFEPQMFLYKDGEEELDTAVADDYVGGQPLEVTANGKMALCKDVTAVAFVGCARNTKTVDAANGKVTYYTAICKVTLKPEVLLASGGTPPYAEAFALYAPKDQLAIDAAGLWTRAGANPKKLLVIRKDAATEGLICWLRNF